MSTTAFKPMEITEHDQRCAAWLEATQASERVLEEWTSDSLRQHIEASVSHESHKTITRTHIDKSNEVLGEHFTKEQARYARLSFLESVTSLPQTLPYPAPRPLFKQTVGKLRQEARFTLPHWPEAWATSRALLAAALMEAVHRIQEKA
jgi:hypothetical protein